MQSCFLFAFESQKSLRFYGDKKIVDLYKKMGYEKNEWKKKIEAIQSKVAYNSDFIIDICSLVFCLPLSHRNLSVFR